MVDHKPLVGLLSNRSLADITNLLQLLLVEKTMGWNFSVKHFAGVSNLACDALSRYPWSEKPVIPGDVDSVLVASLTKKLWLPDGRM